MPNARAEGPGNDKRKPMKKVKPFAKARLIKVPSFCSVPLQRDVSQ